MTIKDNLQSRIKPRRKLFTAFLIIGFIAFGFADNKAQPQDDLDKQLWEQAKDIAKRILLIDCHSHDLFKPASKVFPRQVDIEMIKNTGINGIVKNFPIDPKKKDDPKTHVINELKQFRNGINKNTRQIEKAEEFLIETENNKPAVLLGLESFHGLFDGKVESLDDYYDLGVRTICISNGGKDLIYEKDGNAYKVTEFASELLKRMNNSGIACDLTHLPDTVRQMLIDISKAPAYVSHANVRGVVNASFNISDTTLNKLALSGGVVGLTFFSEYVSEECLAQKGKTTNPLEFPRATIEEFIDHIDYIKEKAGIDFICIGSDYGGSGRISPKGLETIEGFPLIIYHLLKRSYSEDEINKVMSLNFINYLNRVEKYSALNLNE